MDEIENCIRVPWLEARIAEVMAFSGEHERSGAEPFDPELDEGVVEVLGERWRPWPDT